MSGVISREIYVPPGDRLAGWLDDRAQLQREEATARRRRRYAMGMSASVLALSFVLAGVFIARHEQQINHDTKEIAPLAKAQGYIDARTYKPTEGNKAFIVLTMRGCEPNNPEISINDVTATYKVKPTGTELEFSRTIGEQRVNNQWVNDTETWTTPGDFCKQEALRS